MALKATIFKAELAIADLDRHYYHTHQLTLARHPSENDARLMVRLLAFALNAHPQLHFTRGLCIADEPALWRHDLNGTIRQWIDLGHADEKRMRQACQRADEVIIYTYQGAASQSWWQQLQHKLVRLHNLSVYYIPPPAVEQLAALTQRTMHLKCTIQEGDILLTNASSSTGVTLQHWQVQSA